MAKRIPANSLAKSSTNNGRKSIAKKPAQAKSVAKKPAQAKSQRTTAAAVQVIPHERGQRNKYHSDFNDLILAIKDTLKDMLLL